MGGTVYQLLGFPGTGKYTVARELTTLLRERGERVSLLDNHSTANLIWELVSPERRFEPAVLARLHELRRCLLDAAVELSPSEQSFVFTNFVKSQTSPSIFDIPATFAERRGARLVAIVLSCDLEELQRRVVSPGRAERMKVASAERVRQLVEAGQLLPDWPEMFELDTTKLSATAAAERILSLITE